jgi:purine-binding chemotaxis protein CheW
MNIPAEKNRLKILHFEVQKNHYCLDLAFINQVLPLVALKLIPNSENYIAGLLNLGGVAITVIDFAMRVGIQRSENYSINTPILLCAAEEQQIGIIIDSIFGIEDIDRQAIQTRSEFEKPGSFFLGALPLENEMAFVFNIHTIL